MESQSQSMPLAEPSAWRPDPLLEKPEGVSPPRSEPGRQSFGDRDGAESWATVRTTRDSFETASTSHQHTQERSMSECSDRDDQQPVLTGTDLHCRYCCLLCTSLLCRIVLDSIKGALTSHYYFTAGDRSFCVKGKVQEDEDKLSLRLRIGHTEGGGTQFSFPISLCRSGCSAPYCLLQDAKLLCRHHSLLAGAPKTIEFDFDLAADTAYSVANEMVSDLSLSHEDAKVCGNI